MKTFDDSNIPKAGEELELEPDVTTEPDMTVTVKRTRGLAEILEVEDADGQRGVVALQADGSWWWIRKIDPRDPWSGDPDFWKKDASGG